MARRKAAATETPAEQQAEVPVSASETRVFQESVLNEQQYLGLLASQLMHPNHANMQPEHIEARCAEALAKAEVLLATLKARYNK